MTDLTPEQNGGVLKTVLVEGTGGLPMTGDTVCVHYVGTLLDGGEQFDSSRDRGDKFEFTLGTSQVIKGWDLGVATMKRGEKCDLVCTADYAYGQSGSPPKIPPGATLKFEVELFDFYGDDISDEKDKSILKRIYTKGQGYTTPNDGARMKVEIEGFTVPGDVSFGSYSGDLLHGEESANGFPPCIEKVLDDMKSGEKCEIIVQSKHAFKETTSSLSVFPKAPLNQEVKFVIDLKSFEKEKESWEMNVEEKIEQASLKRESAKAYLQKGDLVMAIKLFDRVVKIVEDERRGPSLLKGDGDSEDSDSDSVDQGEDKEDQVTTNAGTGDNKKEGEEGATNGEDNPNEVKTDPRVTDLLETSHLNLSLCLLKNRDYSKAMEHCDEVLSGGDDVTHARKEKALYRKGECLFLLHEYETARELFSQVTLHFPNNTAAKKRMEECTKQAKEEKEKEKQRYQRMFKTFST